MSDNDLESAKNQKARNRLSSEQATNAVISIDDIRIRHELPRVLAAFERWCAKENPDVQRQLLVPSLKKFLRRYAVNSGDRKLTVLRLYPFATTFDDFKFSMKPADYRDMLEVVDSYLRFLKTTDMWSGTRDELRRAKSYFDGLRMPDPDPCYSGIPELRAPSISAPRSPDSEALSEVEGLVLTQRLGSFLTWFGARREITCTRMLNRKYVQEAAASLEIAAMDESVAPLAWPRPKNGPVIFKNANHVPRLKLYWDALVGAGLIRLTPSRAYPTELAARFVAGNPDDVVAAVRTVARHMYRSVAEETNDGYNSADLGYLTRYFLLEASVTPVKVELLKHPVRGLGDADPRGGPQAIANAWQRLETLRDEGLVAIGSTLSIPTPFLEPLVLALAEPSAMSYEFDSPGDEKDDYS